MIAILTVLLIVGVFKFFGKITTSKPVSLKKQVQAIKDKRILFGHSTTFFFMAGHFTLYGYLTPFVSSIMGFSGVLITVVYLIYGAAAVNGGGLAGISADKFGIRRSLLTVILLLSVCLLILPYLPIVLFWVILIIYGVLSWAITPPMQSYLVRLSPETSDIQQSLNISALHLGIALGTFIGSGVVDLFSVQYNALVGFFIVLISLGTALMSLQKEKATVS